MSNTTTRIQSDADKVKQAGREAGSAVQDAAHAAGQKAQDLAHTATEKVKDVAQAAGQKAQDLAQTAGEKARDAAHTAGQKAEDATASLGGTLKSAADTVRSHTPNEGMFGRASDAVAGALEHGGQYLQEKNLSGMADDMTEMIRRNPIPAVLFGVGLGFLLGRTLRS
jgi:phage-related minor tail protein